MNKLTIEIARRDIGNLKQHQANPKVGLSIREEHYLQALEIALPVLEQQEVKSILLSDYKCDDDLVYPMYECSDCQLRHLPEERRPSQQVGRTKCPRCECLKLKRHIVDHRDPDERPTDTYRQIENDGWVEWKGGKCPEAYSTEVQVKYRDGMGMEDAAGDFSWTHDNEPDDIIAYRVIENDGREE